MWTPAIKNGSLICCVYYYKFTALPVAFLPRLKITILASRNSLAQGGASLFDLKPIVQQKCDKLSHLKRRYKLVTRNTLKAQILNCLKTIATCLIDSSLYNRRFFQVPLTL
ncbi:MAG: hypothetical protein Q8N35_17535 [Methylococcaceae bacterium]|jgi:hypothetical protein|nr:hypothetical protein [Methylococcaceae bacterium]